MNCNGTRRTSSGRLVTSLGNTVRQSIISASKGLAQLTDCADHVLSTFKDTQSLPSASLDDVETYRTYLATRNPIAEIETRFLDPADDLVCLAGSSRPSSPSNSFVSPTSEDMLTPMPLKTTFGMSPFPHAPV